MRVHVDVVCVHVRVCAYAYTCVCVCNVCVHVRVCACVYMHICTLVNMRVREHMSVRVYIYQHICLSALYKHTLMLELYHKHNIQRKEAFLCVTITEQVSLS